MRALELSAVIFCDDIRREISNKEILIGVYAADIVLASFPGWFPLAIWIEIQPNQLGKLELELRLSINNKPPMNFKIGLEVHELAAAAVSVSGLQILVEETGSLKLEMKDDEKWVVIKQKKILQGEVKLAMPLPTLVGGPAGNG